MSRLSEAQREEYLSVLQRAFAGGNETVHVDGWCSKRGIEALGWAHEQDWCSLSVTSESQYTANNYTITSAGRAALQDAEQ